MTAPGRIIRGSLTVTEQKKIFAGEVKVNVTVNGKEQAQESIVKNRGIFVAVLFSILRSN